MDSVTHIALGACIGELYAGKSLGKKALIIGAAAQSIPDIDFVASLWLTPAEDLLAHRGFTHSILFILLLAYPLGLILKKSQWLEGITLPKLVAFLMLEMGVHIFLDAFNAYGTAWFEPFSHYRISFNTLFVADPFFSAPIGIVLLLLSIYPTLQKRRKSWATIAIVVSTIYLSYAVCNKLWIDLKVEQELNRQNITYQRYFSTPTPGNVWLWYIVAEDATGFHIGYRSVFDSNQNIEFQHFNRNDHYLDSISDHENLQRLKRFSEGYYLATRFEGKLVFNDLRFGQMTGWEDPQSPFVFYYYLDHPNDNELLIQRGRFSKWTNASALSFMKRIGGN